MGKQQFPHKILWLASYPKSGNTWFRAFLSALLNEGQVEINSLDTDGIFSSRDAFDRVTDLDSRDLYDVEVKLMIPDVFRYFADQMNKLNIIKIHDAYEKNAELINIVPDDVTLCAVYFIRNPLDIAGSLANHNNSTIEDAVKTLNNVHATLASQKNNLNKNNQFRQVLSDWSSHVKSWTTGPSFPVYVIRYEDMLTNTFDTFKKVLENIGWQFTDDQILKAIEATSFEQLSSQEKEKGFYEKNPDSQKFFRSGTMRNWETELSPGQILEITTVHNEIMYKYGYIT